MKALIFIAIGFTLVYLSLSGKADGVVKGLFTK